jgi:hypothetical protein
MTASLGPRCKHCRALQRDINAGRELLPEGAVVLGDFSGVPCPTSPTKEHEFIEPEYDTTPSPGVPDPPSDPVGRLIWDLQYAVTEVPPLDPVPTCTRSLALATAYHAQASGRQAAALERIATALERVMEETDPIRVPTMAELTERGRGVWRVGGKVPVNVYEGDRPVCQCHSEEDARSIVETMNRAIPTIPTACGACGRIRLITGACSGCGQMAADCRCSSETGARA